MFWLFPRAKGVPKAGISNKKLARDRKPDRTNPPIICQTSWKLIGKKKARETNWGSGNFPVPGPFFGLTPTSPRETLIRMKVPKTLIPPNNNPEPGYQKNRQEFIKKGFSTYGGFVKTRNLQESIDFVNDYAPEHMEILVQEPFSILGKIKNAGEILLGENTPITAGNFSLGVNAILPTGGSLQKHFHPLPFLIF